MCTPQHETLPHLTGKGSSISGCRLLGLNFTLQAVQVSGLLREFSLAILAGSMSATEETQAIARHRHCTSLSGCL